MSKPSTQTLGSVQLRHEETNEVILVPTPSRDPNDPLNWSTAQKYYLLGLVSVGMFLVNFVAVGPSVALASIAISFFGAGPNLSKDISGKASYFQTATSLMIGVGNLFWVPLATKYGKRPVYIASFLLLTVCSVWCGVAKSFESELAARIILGTACGAPEIIAPLTLADIFFLHQRGTMMVIYTCALSCGVGAGVVISGLITMHNSWRAIYWLSTALLGVVTILVIFTFPETSYIREPVVDQVEGVEKNAKLRAGHTEEVDVVVPPKRSFTQNLRIFSTTYTHESFFVLAMRPVIAITLPTVLWATLISCHHRDENSRNAATCTCINFTTVQATNIAIVYIVDSYRPIAGEVIVTQSVFKALFGFLLSFYVDQWIDESGYIHVFGTLAGLSAAVFICVFPFYYCGYQLRHATWQWGFIKKLLHWDVDREVGE
ncbi:uncharacterized protein N7496_000354 [Penicillium cataractarum]|uniref:Major facilitator superfamily (MFS) profile domain-containing protein n=1 Tax=Penicillium cataractarum TaxID=2100454 RepID=A0A9X0B5Y5_9EURO|nr:uncharacterized protein N7496_000354 [Penicillium cataractarum]KAJ5389286.1 hypothetical protein N7496_000354 [Penicillium cataractarum]